MMFSLCMFIRNLQAGGAPLIREKGRHKTQSKQSCNPITRTDAEHCHCRRTAGAAARTEELGGREAAAAA